MNEPTIGIAVRVTLILIGVVLGYTVIKEMVRKNILEMQGILWVLAAIFMAAIGIFPQCIIKCAELLEFDSPLSVLFLILDFVFLILIFLCSKWISQLTKRVHELAMQVSLLNQENERIMKRLSEITGLHKTKL